MEEREVINLLLNHLYTCLKVSDQAKELYLNSIIAFKKNLMQESFNLKEGFMDANSFSDECFDHSYRLDELRDYVTVAKIQMAEKREYELDAANLENLVKLQPNNAELQEKLEDIKRLIYYIEVDYGDIQEVEAELIKLEEEHSVFNKNKALKLEQQSDIRSYKQDLLNFFDKEIWSAAEIKKNANLTSEFLQNKITEVEKELGIAEASEVSDIKNSNPKMKENKIEGNPVTVLDIALPSEGFMVIKTKPKGEYALLVEEDNFDSDEIHFSERGKKHQNFEELVRNSLANKLSRGYPTTLSPDYRTCLTTILNEEISARFTNESEALLNDFFEEKEQYHGQSLVKLWEIRLLCKFNFDTFQFEAL